MPKLTVDELQLRGTLRPSRIREETAEDGLTRIAVEPPAELKPAEAAVWSHVVASAPWLRALDEPLLGVFCRAVVEKNVGHMLRLGNALRITPITRPRSEPAAPPAKFQDFQQEKTAA